ncbi:hypothetical protein EmuJ_000736600 [Echinococcus multilocularis]|uniref:Uncharacterized protein n=1 Tax=Echinococcus multilocularis TaxID=6211 RepID=A0A068YBX6_ECHMU|nr:hypothetical protein EmuJ_000736600 [Echinococcus multilocularis]
MPFNPSNLKVAHRSKEKLHPPMANYADFPPLLTAPQERHYLLSTVEDLFIILEGEKCPVPLQPSTLPAMHTILSASLEVSLRELLPVAYTIEPRLR